MAAILSDDEKRQIIEGKTSGDRICAYGITHYRYDDCPEQDLAEYGDYKLHKDCLNAFLKMQTAAKEDNLNLEIVSAYRSSKYQIEVFKRKFTSDIPSDEDFKARLKYSAPSGFSEHHTGLALDINSTEEEFEQTPEFWWLVGRAAKYGFEMSFPENNSQGLGYEPWHWRYVGVRGEYNKVFETAKLNDEKSQINIAKNTIYHQGNL
ncbi:D-alanyl-D-alanine carboxypeptidase family protein [bacterium]|nr:D-alanyl-D-alanine carboxypeptidase family protein [bacterium]